MGAFNTDVAKYANNLFHSKNLLEILESAEANLEKGLLTQDDKGNCLLHYLSTKNALNAVEHLIDFLLLKYNDKKIKFVLDIANHKGMTISHIVFGFDSHDLVQYLVKYNADLLVENASGDRPLEIGVMQNKVESIKVLYSLINNRNVNNPFFASYRGKSLLQIAIESESEEVFCFLLSKHDLNYIERVDFCRNNIIHTAAHLGKMSYLTKILIQNPEFDVNQHNGSGLSAIEIAYKEGFVDIIIELIRYGGEISKDLAHSIGYKTVENITQTIIASVVDNYGTFVGISKDKSKIHGLKEKIICYIADMRVMPRNEINPKMYNLVDKLIENLQNISGTKITRNLDEIKKMLSPILNEFIKEAAYV
jgi:ankyrin repeat protein